MWHEQDDCHMACMHVRMRRKADRCQAVLALHLGLRRLMGLRDGGQRGSHD